MKWNSINLTRRAFVFIPRKTARHHPQAVHVPMAELLYQELSKLATTQTNSEFVLPQVADRYLRNPSGISIDISKLLKAAGIITQGNKEGLHRKRAVVEYSMHSFRHTFCSMAANAGIDLSVIRAMVGHTQTYYKHHKCLIKRDEICEFYGKSIQIKSISNSSIITITPQGTIREALNDINFFLAISSGNEMVVNGTPRKIKFNDLKEADEKELLRERKQFENTIEALAMLGADDNIEISSLSEEDKLNLSIIVHAFKNNCVVNLTPANRNIGLHTLKIGQQNILVMAAVTDVEGKYRLYNITKNNLKPTLEIDGKTTRVSQFYLLDVEHWRSTTNLDYDFILTTVKEEFGCSDDYISDVNMMVLNMLTAYDSQENQNAALLNTVIGITEFMKNQSCDRDGLVIYTLNYLQAIKRKQELSPDEKSGLLEILDSSESTVIKVAANILLERFDKAKILFEQLSEEEQLSITAYPIAKLWDNAPFKTIDE